VTDAASNPSDPIQWARQVNATWIVQGELKKTAALYLHHLAKTDPDRLARSCVRAKELIRRRRALDDPKPYFYGALFSLCTEEEVDQFLAEHWFLRSIVPAGKPSPPPREVAGHTLEETLQMRARIQRWIEENSDL